MRIAVCVKHVPAGRVRLDPDTGRMDRTGAGELNDADRYAIEEALRLGLESGGDVVAVSMGPEPAMESLRTALAMGADRAVLVQDPAAEGSDLVATSKVLAAALAREEPDVVLFGQQSSDGGGALLWAAVAERLQRPFVSQAGKLTVDGSAARVERETEVGDEVIEAALPAVIAVSDAINEPRYPSLKGMMGAKKKPLDVVTLADLGLGGNGDGDGSKTEVLALGTPLARANSLKIEDDGNGAQQILDFLVDKQLV